MANKIEILNNKYSTTKLCYKILDDKFLGSNGKIKDEYKFKINNPKFKIQNSKIIGSPEDKFKTILFLPEGEGRKDEGGLRTKGYFKFSYRKDGPNWYIDNEQDSEKQTVNLPTADNRYTALPLITIITVVYNGEKYLEETIISVISQTYPNVEYIIIDGGSTDGTLDIIKKYEDYIDYWVSERDSGIYDAWNKAIIVSFGEWCGFIGADDYYEKNALSIYIEEILCFVSQPIDYISSKVVLLDKNGKKIRIIGSQWNWKDFSKSMNVAHVGSLHNKRLYKGKGLYDTKYKICADYELLLRANKNLSVGFINKITASMRIAGISNSNLNVFHESYLAKKEHTQRNILILKCEQILSVIKYKIRSLLWY